MTSKHLSRRALSFGPVLHSIYTADLSDGGDVVTAIYADDTACLAIDPNPGTATQKLQSHLIKIDQWQEAWRIKPNTAKSVQIPL